MEYYVLGIDTSNYTTSIAIVDQNKRLLIDNRKPLFVKEGQRGLRQSEALFQHVLNMPVLFENAIPNSISEKIVAVAVSSRPRPLEDSYMPVFLAATSYGQVLSHALNCSYMEFSHQENHIEAAQWSSGEGFEAPYVGVHISGGTTEILSVKNTFPSGYDISIVGGTADLSAGQLIDRVGVRLGYGFPAGKAMDDAANSCSTVLKLPISVKDSTFNFSGLETKAYQLLEHQKDPLTVAGSIMDAIGRTLGKALINTCAKTGLHQVLCMGGVASSNYIKKYLTALSQNHHFKITFGDKKYCTDNAVGTALLGLNSILKKDG